MSESPPEDRIVPLDPEKLFALVEGKTPWGRAAFQRMLDAKFEGEDTALLSMKLRARDLIGLPREMQNLLRELQISPKFKGATVTYIGEIQPLPKLVDKPKLP